MRCRRPWGSSPMPCDAMPWCRLHRLRLLCCLPTQCSAVYGRDMCASCLSAAAPSSMESSTCRHPTLGVHFLRLQSAGCGRACTPRCAWGARRGCRSAATAAPYATAPSRRLSRATSTAPSRSMTRPRERAHERMRACVGCSAVLQAGQVAAAADAMWLTGCPACRLGGGGVGRCGAGCPHPPLVHPYMPSLPCGMWAAGLAGLAV